MIKFLVPAAAIIIALAVTIPMLLGSDGGQEDGLTLNVTSPANESVVYAFSTQVVGETEPDAVVSVNGVPVEVEAGGQFTTTVSLEEGPNAIEIIATNYEGEEASTVLVVIRIPQ